MNYSYVTLLSTDSYLPGVELLAASLQAVQSRYPLAVMTTNNLSEATIARLHTIGVTVIPIERIATPTNIMQHNMSLDPVIANTWKDCLTKFQVWTLTQYDKIIMCDCDLLITKNCDHCFEMPNMTAALDGEYFDLWPIWPHFNTGFFVVKPDVSIFNDICKFVETVDPSTVYDAYGRKYVLADQELLNLYYSDWINKPEQRLDRYYNIFAPHIPKVLEDDVRKNAYFVHFTGSKPWNAVPYSINNAGELTSLYFYSYANALCAYLSSVEHYDNDEWLRISEQCVGKSAYEVYGDMSLAEKCYKSALDKDPENEILQADYTTVHKVALGAKYITYLKPVICQMYNELAETHHIDVNAYLMQNGVTDYHRNMSGYQTVEQLASMYNIWEAIKCMLFNLQNK